MSTVALQAMFDRMLGRFVLPLVSGGEALVSYPIGPAALEYFCTASPTDPEVGPAIALGRTEAVRELLLDPTQGELAADEVPLVVALHNVLLADHFQIAHGVRGPGRW